MFFLIKPEGHGGGISIYHKPRKFTIAAMGIFFLTSNDFEIIVSASREQ